VRRDARRQTGRTHARAWSGRRALFPKRSRGAFTCRWTRDWQRRRSRWEVITYPDPEEVRKIGGQGGYVVPGNCGRQSYGA
jgi:hypothetical protein